MGRDIHAEALLRVSPASLRIALPAVCLMEAWSVYEDEEKRRNIFENTLSSQISQLRRDLTSVHAKALVQHLQQARTENGDLLNEISKPPARYSGKAGGKSRGFSNC